MPLNLGYQLVKSPSRHYIPTYLIIVLHIADRNSDVGYDFKKDTLGRHSGTSPQVVVAMRSTVDPVPVCIVKVDSDVDVVSALVSPATGTLPEVTAYIMVHEFLGFYSELP